MYHNPNRVKGGSFLFGDENLLCKKILTATNGFVTIFKVFLNFIFIVLAKKNIILNYMNI